MSSGLARRDSSVRSSRLTPSPSSGAACPVEAGDSTVASLTDGQTNRTWGRSRDGRPGTDSQPSPSLLSQNTSRPAIEALDVSRRFQDKVALKDVSLRVEPGEIAAL